MEISVDIKELKDILGEYLQDTKRDNLAKFLNCCNDIYGGESSEVHVEDATCSFVAPTYTVGRDNDPTLVDWYGELIIPFKISFGKSSEIKGNPGIEACGEETSTQSHFDFGQASPMKQEKLEQNGFESLKFQAPSFREG